MGRDREPKAVPKVAEPAVELGPDGKPKRPPRGHKQKGAGTIITAKPAVVTGDGIVLKTHERLPSQLLQEYCQREKKPNPRFFPNPPGHRMRVVIFDPKNNKNDMTFCPNQSFGSDSVARDFAALLALFHYQKTLPLERKMPEPYSTTWITMLANEKIEAATAKANAKLVAGDNRKLSVNSTPAVSSTSAVLPGAMEESMSTSKSSSITQPVFALEVAVPVLDRNTADWLCESCGNNNFATLASGALRTKCFKCQALKTDLCVLVASTATVANPVSTSNNVKSISADNSSMAKVPVMKLMKAAPAAVVNLKADKQFFSKQDADNARNERIAAKKRKAAYFDALKRANKPMPVYLSQNLRRMLEAVLGLSSGSDAITSSEYGNDEEEGNSLTMDAFLTDYSELVAFAEDACLVSADIQLDLLREVATSLIKQGFFEHDVVKCMQLLLLTQVSEELLERIESTLSSKSSSSSLALHDLLNSSLVRGVYLTTVTEATLSQLCIQLDESRLPVAFDPRKAESKPTFDVYRAPSNATANATANLSTTEQLIVNALRSSGWILNDCVQAVEVTGCAISKTNGDNVESDVDADLLQFFSFSVMSQAAVMSRTKTEPSTTRLQMSTIGILTATGPVGDDTSILEELESLEAIYGDKFQHRLVASSSGTASFHRLSLEVDLVDTASTKCKSLLTGMYTLVVHISTTPDTAGLMYPHCLPLISLQSDCSTGLSGPQQVALTELQCATWRKAAGEYLGECMVFQIYSFLLDSVDVVLSAVIAAKMLPVSLSEELTRVRDYVESSKSDPRVLVPESDGGADEASVADDTTNESSDRSSATGSGYSHGGERGRSKGNHPFWTRNTKGGKFNKSNSTTGRSAAFQAMQTTRRALPAWNMREDFLSLIAANRGLVVTGETGCGKTTQIPQFIHEEQPEAKIVICQPRRLAAIGVASRIADEMDSTIGDRVGYMVKGDSKAGANTRIVFCTYGVLLRRIQDDPTLKAIDYVILDEVHERGIDSDFTLALLMSAAAARKDLKVLLMSATIATERFASYLATGLKVATPSAPSVPVMFIPGFTFPVVEYYKGDFEEDVRGWSWNHANNSRGGRDDEEREGEEQESGRGRAERSRPPRKGDIDYDLLVQLIVSLCTGAPAVTRGKETAPMMSRAEGSILIFVPGVPEINKVMTQLQATYSEKGSDSLSMRIMPLHGNLSPADQKRVFQPAGRREIKIIVATNVAEASITIPDVSVVVDTCRVKEMGFNVETQTSALMAQFAAHDSLLQRRGRAGRVSQGRCFRMMSKFAYDRLPAHGLPEILRSPLDNVILQIKAMLLNMPDSQSTDSMSILGRCLDAPEESVVRLAEQSLVKIQALDPNTFGLTALGKHLSALPCSPRIGRLLIYGALLGCVYPTSCVASCLTARSPFMTSNDPETIQKVNAAKSFFGEGSSIKSDYNVIIRAMQQFEATRNQRSFCREYGLSFERMAEIRQSQTDLMRGLVDIGFLPESSLRGGGGHANRNSHKPKLVAAVYCAGLYPQLAKVLRPPARFVEVMGSALERSAEAKEIKLYIPDQLVLDSTLTNGSSTSFVNPNSSGSNDEYANSDVDINVSAMQRVFLHPSSVNFSNINYRASNFVLYGERQLVVQPASDTYKLFLRDTTEVTAFALLFFGGKLETQFLDGIVTIDGWIRFSATGRIVALVQAIRRAFDQLLEDKILRPDMDISASPVLDVTCQLLETDGLG